MKIKIYKCSYPLLFMSGLGIVMMAVMNYLVLYSDLIGDVGKNAKIFMPIWCFVVMPMGFAYLIHYVQKKMPEELRNDLMGTFKLMMRSK